MEKKEKLDLPFLRISDASGCIASILCISNELICIFHFTLLLQTVYLVLGNKCHLSEKDRFFFFFEHTTRDKMMPYTIGTQYWARKSLKTITPCSILKSSAGLSYCHFYKYDKCFIKSCVLKASSVHNS